MKTGLLIIAPFIAFAVLMSRPHHSLRSVPTPLASSTPISLPTRASSTPSFRPAAVSLSVSPAEPIQGDPLLIEVAGTSSVRSIVFDKVSLPVFAEDGEPAALAPLDLRQAPGTYTAVATLGDGTTVKKAVIVAARHMPSAPLGIPASLGGNTATATQELVTNLVDEAKVINAIPTTSRKLWSAPFRYPLDTAITITDPYGYSRETNGTSIAHKGTDFRAATGTPVVAVNDGTVAYVGYLRDYGNVIALDHGAKVLSIYMHLSKVEAKVGDTVRRGQEIALSGDTGYVLGPHLHLTIRIENVSIDPLVFLKLMGS